MSCHSNSKQLKLDSLLREVCINTEQVLDDSVFIGVKGLGEISKTLLLAALLYSF